MSIIITNTAHAGYRRGGAVFSQGINTFEPQQFTELQLAQIHNDPRLLVQGSDQDIGDEKTGISASAQGNVDTHILSDLVDLIKSLDPQNETLWKKDGAPKASNFPEGVSAEQRDAAWDALVAAQESAEQNLDAPSEQEA